MKKWRSPLCSISPIQDKPGYLLSADPLILQEQLYLLCSFSFFPLLISIFLTSVACYFIWSSANHSITIVWGTLSLGILLLRLKMAAIFRHSKPPAGSMWAWRNRFILSASLSGLLWGSSIFLVDSDPLRQQLFIAIIIVGVTSGSMGSLTPVLGAMLSFSALTLIPVIIQGLHYADVVHRGIGFAALCYLSILFISAIRINRIITNSLRIKNDLKEEILERHQTE